ncbi:alpha/beta fold hydrolase [Evansella halocellulosilytica]|uniref:alpha/beta fold hydrolase n=1 Tax=Evansella halocellulosilytica TaxID=2011013 RepID=UPI000BB94FA4|nr:alpha/beta hydrolase [Evansella halocellulosilytica]
MWKWEVTEAKGVFVIVHGAGEYHVRYHWVIEQLTELGYNVIMGDLPGQGTTDGPRGHVNRFSDYVTVVKGWLREARKYKLPVTLLGHSMGGLISIHTLMNLSKNELPNVAVLSSPCLGLVNNPTFSKKTASYLLNYVAPKIRFPSGLEPGSGTRDEWMRQRDFTDDLLIKRVSVRWYRELANAIRTAQDKHGQFPAIPLLVTQGGDDRIVNKNEVKRWFDTLTLTDKYYKEWDSFYHEVLNDPGKEKVLAHLIGFVTLHETW